MKKLMILTVATLLSGCVAYTVVDTAASVVGTAVKTTAKVGGAVVGGAADLVTGKEDKPKE